jgi:hypothetical protein
MALIGLAENLLPSWNDFLYPAIVEHCRRRQANAAVMVLGVVAGEEDLAEAARIVNGAEAVRLSLQCGLAQCWQAELSTLPDRNFLFCSDR